MKIEKCLTNRKRRGISKNGRICRSELLLFEICKLQFFFLPVLDLETLHYALLKIQKKAQFLTVGLFASKTKINIFRYFFLNGAILKGRGLWNEKNVS